VYGKRWAKELVPEASGEYGMRSRLPLLKDIVSAMYLR